MMAGVLAPMPIARKTVVITGGSRGIGLGLVERFLLRDNSVITTSRAAETGEPLRALQAKYGGRLRVTQLDMTRSDGVAAWADGLQQQHIDVLVNNAGIYGKRGGFQDYDADDFMSVFASNAVGPFLVAQQLHRRGLLGGQAAPSLVVNMTSIMASHGDTTVSSAAGGGYAYRASKAALNIITKAMCLDLAADNIKCILMHPGYVRGTGITGDNGAISVDESTDGILQVLESGKACSGGFYAYSGQEIPW